MIGAVKRREIGAPVRRREDLRLITGAGRYSDDLSLPNQAYAMMVRSPHAHALIRSLETAAAAAVPGVLAVLTAEDSTAGRAQSDAAHCQFPPRRHLDQEQGRRAGLQPSASCSRSYSRKSAMSARLSRSSSRPAVMPPRTLRKWSRSTGTRCPPSPAPAMLPKPMRRARAQDFRQYHPRRRGRRRGGNGSGVRRRRPCGQT